VLKFWVKPTVAGDYRTYAGGGALSTDITNTLPAGVWTEVSLEFTGSPYDPDLFVEFDSVSSTITTSQPVYFDDFSVTEIEPASYSDIDMSFSTKDCINEVQVKSIEWDPTDSTRSIEVPYGPYRDDASIAEWGRYAADFTVHGKSSGGIATLASTILTKNKTPQVRVNSITVPILKVTDISRKRALVELYDYASVNYSERAYFNNNLDITGIEHEISTDGWLMTLTFSDSGSVASPQVTPPVQSSGASGAPTAVAVPGESGWISACTVRKISGVVTVHIDLNRDGSSGAGSANVTCATIPIGYRPLNRYYFTALDTGSGGLRAVYVDTDGGVKFVFSVAAGAGTIGAFTYVVGS
jgi:hypothetical protein